MASFTENYKLEGDNLEIFTFPDSILLKKAQPVTVFDKNLKLLCKNMLYTMYNAPGVGLAAPQIGKSIRMFVVDVDYEREKKIGLDGEPEYDLSDFNPQVFINPIISVLSDEILANQEGCLSVPGIYEDVERYSKIKIDYQDLEGNNCSIEAADTLSVCIQHEYDHLDGIVFLDRLSNLKKMFYKKKLIKAKKKHSKLL